MDLAAAFQRFEAIGSNCEFGIVQALANPAAPVGLFRYVVFEHTDQMIQAIEAGLEGMFEPDAYAFAQVGWLDHAVECKRFGFRFHTGVPLDVTGTAVLEQHVEGLRALKSRFLALLASGEAVFAYRHPSECDEPAMRRLLQAIRRHGPGRLLAVREDADRPFGSCVDAGDGLTLGSIRQLTREDPAQVDFAAWEKIVRGVVPAAPNGLADAGVVTHHFGHGEKPYHLVLRGLPRTRCTTRAKIYIPADCSVRAVSLAMSGYQSEGSVAADVTRRDCWQSVSVTATVPAGHSTFVPMLSVPLDTKGVIYSCGWEVVADPLPAPVMRLTGAKGDPLGFLYNHAGLNNQKICLLGLLAMGKQRNQPVYLPDFYLQDQQSYVSDVRDGAKGGVPQRDERRVRLGEVYRLEALLAFAREQGISVLDGPPIGVHGGWNFFQAGGEAVGKAGPFGNAFTRGFFASLISCMRETSAFADIKGTLSERGIDVVLQCRIEQDWAMHTKIHRDEPLQSADEVPGLMDILAKMERTLPSEARRGLYLVNDEAGLPVPKDVIRKAVADRFGFPVYWKSDLLPDVLTAYPSLLLSMLDFEIAVSSGIFVGTTVSSFSNLVTFERFVRTGQPVRDHFIYNAPSLLLERRTDNGTSVHPVQAVSRGRPIGM